MKKFYLLLLFLSMGLSSVLAQEVTYTDGNGAVWTFANVGIWNSETYHSDYYWTLKSVSNYGDDITVPNSVTYNEVDYPVEVIGENVFKDNKSVARIILPSTIKRLNYSAFNGCSSLKEIGDISHCEYINSEAFHNCISLEKVDLSVCTYIGSSAFFGCQNLQDVKSIANATSIGSYAFDECKSLKQVDLAASVSIGSYAFHNCSNLQSVGSLANATIEYGAFQSCNSLKNVDLSTAKKIGEYAFSYCTALESVGDLSAITGIDNSVFSGCSALKAVDLSACKTIGSEAFYDCRSLTEVNLAACQTLGTSAFESCSKLKEVKNFTHFTSVPERAFLGCQSLETIDLSNCTSIDNNVFGDCSSLKAVDLSACKAIGSEAFNGCRSLTEVNLAACQTLGTEAFANCSKLKEVKNFTHFTSVTEGAFYNCQSLETIDLNNCASIDNSAFSGCRSLTSIGNLPLCESIGDEAFACCSKLVDVTLTSTTLQSIGDNAFDHTGTLTLMTTTPPTLVSIGDYLLVKVPAEALATYQSADVWKYIATRIFAIGDTFNYTVDATAKESSSSIHELIGEENLRKVVDLKVSGTINSYDIMILRNKTPNLHNLDLTDARIVDCNYEYYTGYHSENDILGANSFRELTKLLTVKLPNTIKEIRENAFYECSNLQSITMYEGLKSIGSSAFNYCSQLKSITLPSGLVSIDSNAFGWCESLENVDFPPTLETIGERVFSGCGLLKAISLPVSLKIIGGSAFNGCPNLQEVKIPSSVTNIYGGAFSGCSRLAKVYTYTIEPTTINQNTFSNYETTDLYVPTTSYNNYYWDTEWSQFRSLIEFDEPYTYFYINKDYVLDNDRIDGTPDADVNPGGSLTVEGDEDQDLGDLNVISDGDTGTGASVIADDNINANWLKFKIEVNANKWYFFSFPFNIKLSNIELDTKKEGDGHFVFRYYDGAERANNGKCGWKNLPVATKELQMGQGYIFQCDKMGTLILKVKKPSFKAEDQSLSLTAHDAASAQDAGWNFIGNPYISYYDINDMEYTAPITIWNGSSYEAIRPADDDYHFHPFQAFFVQKPEKVDEVTFTEENRTTYLKSKEEETVAAARAMSRGVDETRLRIELTIGDSEVKDKTRIVFNEDAKTGYETACDAAKFMSMENVPQIYSLDDESKYAINERPAGDVRLGFVAKSAGTFSIGAKRMDTPVQLYDKVTNETIDLTESDYAFETEEGTFEDRFVVKASVGGGTETGGAETGGTEASVDPVDETTGIASVKQQTGVSVMSDASGIYLSGVGEAEVYIYTMNGTMLAKNVQDGFVPLPKATYIVKVNKMAAKLMVK